MLMIARKQGQSVVMSGGVVITVHKLSEGRVTLSFDAPDTVSIKRHETQHAELVDEHDTQSTPESSARPQQD